MQYRNLIMVGACTIPLVIGTVVLVNAQSEVNFKDAFLEAAIRQQLDIPFSDVKPLASLTNLTDLWLDSNQISNCQSLPQRLRYACPNRN